MKSAVAVARRCLCLELLHQRLGLETEADTPQSEREAVRVAWRSRLAGLGVEPTLLEEERRLLEAPVGTLDENDLDDLDGRATGALVFLWALARTDTRPTYAATLDRESLLADAGLLGDGSIARASAASESAKLRDEQELTDALTIFERLRGKSKDPSEPEKIMAGIAAHHLAWVLDDDLAFD
jgi:hypothetical protein